MFEQGAFNILGVRHIDEVLPILKHVIELAYKCRMEPRTLPPSTDIVKVRESERKHYKRKYNRGTAETEDLAKRQKLTEFTERLLEIASTLADINDDHY